MPGRNYIEAHTLLQESLAGVSYPTLRSMYQRQEQPDKSLHHSPDLPPIQDDIDPSFGLAGGLQSSDRSSSTRPSTPFNFGGTSVTPETQITPPSLCSLHDAKVPHALHGSVSHAESFATAREDLTSPSSLGGSRAWLPMLDDEIDENRSMIHSPGLKTGFFSSSERSFSFHVANTLPGGSLPRDDVQEFRSYGQTNLRLDRRHRKLSHGFTFLNDRRDSETNMQAVESPRSWYEASTPEGDREVPRTPEPRLNDKEADFVNMTPPKRLPSSTKPSAVIDADIHESPDSTPQREHRLRHYHKHGALREERLESQRNTPVPDTLESPLINSREISLPKDDDVRARTRSSLVAALPVGLRANGPLWRRSKSLSVPRTSKAGSSHFRNYSDVSDGMGDVSFRDRTPLDQLYDLSESATQSLAVGPTELRHLHTRKSSGHLTVDSLFESSRRSGTVSARHTLTQASPFSEMSEGLIMNDARAISIVPHNNDSLLVVHQQRSAPASTAISPVLPPKQNPLHDLAIPPPHTPANDIVEERASDSPLTNPRAPPDPPVLSVTKSTPEKTHDVSDGTQRRSLNERPPLSRHESLVKRAMRTFMAPSLRRRHTTKSRRSRSRGSSGENSTRESSGKRPHPFWQPRGFWDDLSDMDDVDRDDAHWASGEANEHDRRALQARPRRKGESASTATGQSFGLSRSVLQRLASLKKSARQRSVRAGEGDERTNSQRRRLASGFKEKILERTQRRQEQRREQERSRIRESIGFLNDDDDMAGKQRRTNDDTDGVTV